MPLAQRPRKSAGADTAPGLPLATPRGAAMSLIGGSRRESRTAQDVTAAAIGLAILGFMVWNLSRPFMRWPSALQGAVMYFLLALVAGLFYPLIRDTVILRRLSGKWRFVAHGAVAVFFMALIVLLGYGQVRHTDGGEPMDLPVAAINGVEVAGDPVVVPRHVTMGGPLDEEEAVAVWWRREGTTRWSGPMAASAGPTGWQATLDFASPAPGIYNVLAMPAMAAPGYCRTCTPLRLAVADLDAAIESITVDGLVANLNGKVVNPGGEYDLHLLRSDSGSQAEDREDVAPIRASAAGWNSVTELRKAYHYPNTVTLTLAGLRHGGDSRTVPLAQTTVAVPEPDLAIRKINGRGVAGARCAVEPFSQVTVEGTSANLLNSERLWVRLENFDRSADNLMQRRVAAERIGPANWSAKVPIGGGREFQFEAAISESDPGHEAAAFSSPTVTCIATPRH